jgi:hypothetical protein
VVAMLNMTISKVELPINKRICESIPNNLHLQAFPFANGAKIW